LPLLYIYLLHVWSCFDPRGYFKNGFSSFFIERERMI